MSRTQAHELVALKPAAAQKSSDKTLNWTRAVTADRLGRGFTFPRKSSCGRLVHSPVASSSERQFVGTGSLMRTTLPSVEITSSSGLIHDVEPVQYGVVKAIPRDNLE